MPNAPQRFSPFARPKPQAPQPEARGSSAERGYDGEWTAFRNEVITDHPICEHCWHFDGRSVPTKEIDHVIPITGPTDPLRFDRKDVRGLCRAHHHRKTKRLDKRIRAYFDRLISNRMSFETARDATVAKFRYLVAPRSGR